MISEGCILKSCRIHHSVLGIRTRIESGCLIRNSLLMGADYYQSDFEQDSRCDRPSFSLGIGANSDISNVGGEKIAIGCNVKILNKDNVQEADCEQDGFYIRSGIVVVLKDATLPDGMVI